MKRKDGRDRVPWTKSEVDKLIYLWLKGLTYAEIAKHFDHPRNSVASKIGLIRQGRIKKMRCFKFPKKKTPVPTSTSDPKRTSRMNAVDRFGTVPVGNGFR